MEPTGAPPRVVVVGAGITGLTAAYSLRRARPGLDVRVLEARPAPGGNVRTEHLDGFVVDGGPDSFVRTKPEALVLCRELGLEPELHPTEPAARHVYVARAGRLEPMPGGMALAVPTRLGPLLGTRLLGLAGKLRLLLEPFVRAPPRQEDESIASFFERRLGKEAAARLAGPLLGGIYAGDVRALSLRSTFPQLAELEDRHGGLLRGMLAGELSRAGGGTPTLLGLLRWVFRRAPAEVPSPFLSLRGGMGRLVEALVSSLPPGALSTGTAVSSIARAESGRLRITTPGGDLEADAVVLATPAHVAAELLGEPGLRDALAAIPYVSTATVFFGLDRKTVTHPLDGSGFVVPPGEGRLLASTWVSSKWAGRAPEGAALVRAFLGGSREPELVRQSTDEELISLARSELERLMGPLGPARFTRVHRYVDSNPQPVVGHAARLAQLRERLAAGSLRGVVLAGAAYDGVGIPDCVRQARAAADQALAALPPA